MSSKVRDSGQNVRTHRVQLFPAPQQTSLLPASTDQQINRHRWVSILRVALLGVLKIKTMKLEAY